MVSIMVTIINIGLCSRTTLERWKQTISVMLEKDKNIPTIDRLMIIQMFEADFNFLLALVFGHCLMAFARTHCGFNESQYGSMAGKQVQSAYITNIFIV